MIYKKLHSLQASIKAMEKNADAFNYKYLNGDKLLSQVRPRMDEMGLLLLPEVVDIENTPVTYDSYDKYNKVTVSKTEILCTIKMRMTWVDSEDGETLVQSWVATGCNGFDKGFGSALTYGERYYLLKMLHIATDRDDVDAIASKRDEAIQLASEHPAEVAVQEPERIATGLDDDTYGKMVRNYAKGRKSRVYGDYRKAYAAQANATNEMLTQFDNDVFAYLQSTNVDPFANANA